MFSLSTLRIPPEVPRVVSPPRTFLPSLKVLVPQSITFLGLKAIVFESLIDTQLWQFIKSSVCAKGESHLFSAKFPSCFLGLAVVYLAQSLSTSQSKCSY
jgi:hypothetical protein